MELTEVTKFRRAVLTGLARFTWQGTLPEHIYDILYSVVTEDSPRVRCCVHKERAVLKNRINMALGLTVGLNIVEASKIALTEPVNKALPIIDVLPEACDQCPINSSRPISSLREDAVCVSDVFCNAGYDCAYFGKLHADFPTPNDPERPGQYVEDRVPAWDAYTPKERRHGFNYWYSYGTFDEHKNPHYWDTEGRRHDPREWSPLHESGKVVSYLKNEGNVRDPKKPFFIMVGMNPPHSPYRSLDDCMEEDFNLYKNQPLDSLLVRPNADSKMLKAESARYYFASVTGVDRAFGQILDALKELGLDKNTIVVFASDHGETMCSQHTEDPKNSPYSESMNVPFLVRFPDKIKPRVDDLMLSSPDIMPTLLGLAGLADSIPAEVQGRNYAPLFFDEKADIVRPTGALYIQNLDGEKDAEGMVRSYFPSSRGFKSARYTLALYIDRENHKLVKSLLFDDEKDPYQMNNLSLEENQEVVKDLCAEMGKVLKEIDDPWYKEGILKDMIPY